MNDIPIPAKKLSSNEIIFVETYMRTRNASQAYRAAVGSNTKNADVDSQVMLNRPLVKAEIEKRERVLAAETGVTPDGVIRELALIAFADMKDYADWDGDEIYLKNASDIDISSHAIAEVSRMRYGVKIKLHDKVKALDSLCRHLGLFKDKVELTGKDGKDLFKNLADTLIEISRVNVRESSSDTPQLTE